MRENGGDTIKLTLPDFPSTLKILFVITSYTNKQFLTLISLYITFFILCQGGNESPWQQFLRFRSVS